MWLKIAEENFRHEFLVMNQLVPGIDLILGMDFIHRMGGFTIGLFNPVDIIAKSLCWNHVVHLLLHREKNAKVSW